jgi:putative tryptophan/tyrosine transport system substrate-binding protein
MPYVNRRQFITLLGGIAAAWPLAARAQQERMRRLGVLTVLAESDPEARVRVGTIEKALQEHGWINGRNLTIEYRWTAGEAQRLEQYAKELVSLDPDVLLAIATAASAALHRQTRTVPIVFTQVADPIARGFVSSLPRPGGNMTGFAQYEDEVAVKWVELLKQLAPNVARVTVLHDATNPATAGYLRAIEAGGPSLGISVSGAPVRDVGDIGRAFDALTRWADSGLIVPGSPVTSVHRDMIIELAARHRVPAVYSLRYFVSSGGLASYGIDNVDLHRRAVSYVDRILRGEKPANLPVQFANKLELVINLRTATALGLDPPISLLARTDEVIE